jgi:hypothetical protein
LVDHARRELAAINEDPEHAAGIVKVVRAFAEMGCSGGQASVAIEQICELLEFHNLSPLTDSPEEWYFHGEDMAPPAGVWQNKRRGEAFSHDAGKTYYLISEGGDQGSYNRGEAKMHDSRPHTEPRHIQEELIAHKAVSDG